MLMRHLILALVLVAGDLAIGGWLVYLNVTEGGAVNLAFGVAWTVAQVVGVLVGRSEYRNLKETFRPPS